MIRSLTISVLALMAAMAHGAPAWKPLFNGKDLSGFYTWVDGQGKDKDTAAIFTVADSAIHVYAGTVAGSKAPLAYLATIKEYTHYRLRLQFKWGVKKFAPLQDKVRDAGLLFHVAGADMASWPRCMEFQIMEASTGDIFAIRQIWVKSTVDPKSILPGKVSPVFMDAASGGVPYENAPTSNYQRLKTGGNYEVAGWNDLELEVNGDTAVFHVNGHVANRVLGMRQAVTASPLKLEALKQGKIALQGEDAEVYYRRMDIMDLTETVTALASAPRARPARVYGLAARSDGRTVLGRAQSGSLKP